MLNPTTGASRVGRIAALGGGALAVTVAGHVAAAGHISATGVLVVGVLMLLVAVFATSTELTLGPLVAFVAGAQLCSHFLLTHLSAHAGHSVIAGSPVSAPTHAHGAGSVSVAPVTDVGGFVGDTLLLAVASAAPMMLMHLVAAVAMALLLRTGERSVFALSRLLPWSLQVILGTLLKPVSLVGCLPRTPSLLCAEYPAVSVGKQSYLRNQISRRGPPEISFYSLAA